jgi:hypothetical protein
VHPETEDHVAVACVVVERKGRLFDPEGLARAVQELVSLGGLDVCVALLDLAIVRGVHGGGSELALHLLQALHVMALIPVVRNQLLDTRLPHPNPASDDMEGETQHQRLGRSGMSLIVDIAGGSALADGPAMTGALLLLCTLIGCSAPPLSGRAGKLIAFGKPPSSSVCVPCVFLVYSFFIGRNSEKLHLQ